MVAARKDLQAADAINEATLKYISGKPSPKTFGLVLPRYEARKKVLENRGVRDPSKAVADHFRDLIVESRGDVSRNLAKRLPGQSQTDMGRSYQFQGLVKNVGENFTSLVAYNLAENLIGTGWAVFRGKAPALKQVLTLSMKGPDGSELRLPVEADITIYRPADHTAVVLSAKTTLKERVHMSVMWRLILEAAKQPRWAKQLRIIPPADTSALKRLNYCFVTADIGSNPDLDKPRNLIKADASFFDYFFVARYDLPHVEKKIGRAGRDAIFHRLSAIYELLEML